FTHPFDLVRRKVVHDDDLAGDQRSGRALLDIIQERRPIHRPVGDDRRHLGYEKVSERRACKTLEQPRSTRPYRLRQKDRRLIEVMRRIVKAPHRCYGA
ncbi:MAG: hypothetical protein AAGH88_15875, partial [Planctomycetota bacterium]